MHARLSLAEVADADGHPSENADFVEASDRTGPWLETKITAAEILMVRIRTRLVFEHELQERSIRHSAAALRVCRHAAFMPWVTPRSFLMLCEAFRQDLLRAAFNGMPFEPTGQLGCTEASIAPKLMALKHLGDPASAPLTTCIGNALAELQDAGTASIDVLTSRSEVRWPDVLASAWRQPAGVCDTALQQLDMALVWRATGRNMSAPGATVIAGHSAWAANNLGVCIPTLVEIAASGMAALMPGLGLGEQRFDRAWLSESVLRIAAILPEVGHTYFDQLGLRAAVDVARSPSGVGACFSVVAFAGASLDARVAAAGALVCYFASNCSPRDDKEVCDRVRDAVLNICFERNVQERADLLAQCNEHLSVFSEDAGSFATRSVRNVFVADDTLRMCLTVVASATATPQQRMSAASTLASWFKTICKPRATSGECVQAHDAVANFCFAISTQEQPELLHRCNGLLASVAEDGSLFATRSVGDVFQQEDIDSLGLELADDMGIPELQY